MPDTNYPSVSLPPTVFNIGIAWTGNGHLVLAGGSYSVVAGDGSLQRVATVLDRFGQTLQTMRSDGTNLIANPWEPNSGGTLVTGSDTTVVAGKSACLSTLPGGKHGFSYADGGNIKFATYSRAEGLGVPATVATGTYADHIVDKNRIVLVLYNSGWYVTVGLVQTDGTYVWNGGGAPVSMGLSAQAKGGSITRLPGGKLSFMYTNSGGTVAHSICENLSDVGVGVWS